MYNYERVATAISYIKEHFREQPDLEDVAKSVHTSPYHFQRLFTEWAGVSPKKFLQFLTVEYAKKILSANASLMETAEETGLSGTSRLHDLFVTIEGMTPGEYKNGGAGLHIRYSFEESPFGDYIIASTGKGICNLSFIEDKKSSLEELKKLWPHAKIVSGYDEHQEGVKKNFANHFRHAEKIKLHLKGTSFQLKVWEALLKIPEGQLTTYSSIAKQVNNDRAMQAVGSAIGNNPVGFIIPCHRVIKKEGTIGEYRWGSLRKSAMIGWEASRLVVSGSS